jgi:murein L,D-transpeptidase YcbB/YkuD
LLALLEQRLDAALARPGSEATREIAGIATLYGERHFEPLWLDAEGHFNAAAQAALARLRLASEDGLTIAPSCLSATGACLPAIGGNSTANAEADLALSLAVVAYGRQAGGARVDPQQVSNLITARPEPAEAEAILRDVAEAGAEAGNRLQAFNPPQPGYAALRDKLAELRKRHAQNTAPAPAAAPSLGLRVQHATVPLIRASFGSALSEIAGPAIDPVATGTLPDRQIATAANDKDAASGPKASAASQLSPAAASRLEAEIIANMERWRWLPRDLGPDRIEVNIPDYALTLTRGNAVVHRTRVVVGKTKTPTPIFSNRMQFVVVNPYWNVPPSILKKEMLPKMAQDPTYLARNGYEVVYHHGQMSVRQPPGERNALGHVKFLFPNQHAVYLHDTPSRSLFAADKRAFSHGCVRVDQPFSLAEAVLGRERGWSEERVRRLVGGSERTITLPEPLPIHLEYFTAYVDETGRLVTREDIYGYSEKVRAVLGLN